jgi:HSP20 family protein
MNIVRRQEQNRPVTASPAELDPFKMMREMMRWDPFREIGPMLTSQGFKGILVPDVDIKETPTSYVFRADLPGMKEKDVDISFTGNRLTLSGKREEEQREEKVNYYSCECSYGSFTRSFTLPLGTDPEHASAELKDGVLTITVPKKAEVQPKQVPVNGEPKVQAKAKG